MENTMNTEDFNQMVEQARLMELQIALITGSDHTVPTNSQAFSPESETGYDECYDYEIGE
jgi:hypothetical protein